MNRLPLMILIFSLLSACSLSSREPIRQTYLLTPTPGTVMETPKAHLKLGKLSASPGLDRSRIVIHVPPYRMDYYAGARWPDNLPDYLQAVMLETMSLSGVADSVAVGSRSQIPNYMMLVRVLDFQAEYKTSTQDIPEVLVRMELTLLRSKAQKIILHQWYTSRKPASENRMSAVIKGFNEAFQEVQDAMIGDINQAIILDLAHSGK
jgi:ABC-type uncharacterized transport system auxiliary subunit